MCIRQNINCNNEILWIQQPHGMFKYLPICVVLSTTALFKHVPVDGESRLQKCKYNKNDTNRHAYHVIEGLNRHPPNDSKSCQGKRQYQEKCRYLKATRQRKTSGYNNKSMKGTMYLNTQKMIVIFSMHCSASIS